MSKLNGLKKIKMINVTDIQDRLRELYPQFRTIWVGYTNISKRRGEHRIMITVFPAGGQGYTMFFSDVVNSVDLNNCTKLINANIE